MREKNTRKTTIDTEVDNYIMDDKVAIKITRKIEVR